MCRYCGGEFDYTPQRLLGFVMPVPSHCGMTACATAMRLAEEREALAEDEARIERMMLCVPDVIRRQLSFPLHPALHGWTADQWFFLHGPTGTGKSTQMGLVAQHLAVQNISFEWYRTRELLRDAQASINGRVPRPTILDNPCRPQVLLLDDFGVERATPYAIDLLGELVMARYDAHRTVGITSNRSLKHFAEMRTTDGDDIAFDRVASRIAGFCQPGVGVMARIDGADHRLVAS